MESTRTDSDRIPLMLIHGAWLSSRSWESFADYFDKRGFAVSAPEWPRKHGDVEQLREGAEELAGLGLTEAASPALAHPSRWHGVVTLTPEEFAYGFVNTFSPEEAAAAYERYAVPETGQIFYEAGFANFHLHPPTELHFKNEERAPLLIVGAEKDHTVPASVSRAQYKKYEHSPAKTEYLEFEGRPHLFGVGEVWEEVAASIDSWLGGVLDTPAPAPQHVSA